MVTASTVSVIRAPMFRVEDLQWRKAAVSTGDTIVLTVSSVNPLGRVPVFNAFLVGSNGSETAVSLDSLGFPAQPVLRSAQTQLRWLAQRYPRVPDTDLTIVTRVRLRLADSSAVAPLLTIVGTHAPVLGVGDGAPLGPLRFRLRAVNAGRPGAASGVELELSEAAAVRVELYDVSGRRVRTLADRTMAGGVTAISWDGRDGNGAPVGGGVYFARVQCAGQVQSVRLLNLP